ncbi:hypothetical protein HK098_007116 [Nowakowskiella sp. JEL0407]|nr:hypothetical protein HK098_007116 [Nowakowskiella sp. JEL0407]
MESVPGLLTDEKSSFNSVACGNKSATFPLQIMGFNVDPLNTVFFSNHSGYPTFSGSRTTPTQVKEIVAALEKNGMMKEYTHVLFGYIGNKDTLEILIDEVIMKLRNLGIKFTFVLDPVLGDNGKLYIPADCIPVYRDSLLSLSNLITPNAFEAEHLSSINITDLNSAFTACNKLHELGAPTIIISSLEIESDNENLYLVASTSLENTDTKRFYIRFAKLAGEFTGTGDLFSALVLAKFDTHELTENCEFAVAVMQGVLRRTLELKGEQLARIPAENLAERLKLKELALVESKDIFESPTIIYRSTPFNS